jgi:hypothetical protein
MSCASGHLHFRGVPGITRSVDTRRTLYHQRLVGGIDGKCTTCSTSSPQSHDPCELLLIRQRYRFLFLQDLPIHP